MHSIRTYIFIFLVQHYIYSSITGGGNSAAICNTGGGINYVNNPLMPGTGSFAAAVSVTHQCSTQTVFLLDLPIEILDKIFSYVGYKKAAQLRVVHIFIVYE